MLEAFRILFILILAWPADVECIEVNVVITPGDLRSGASGHIREIGLFIHGLSEDQIVRTNVEIFEDPSRTKLSTAFPLASKIAERLEGSVRVLSGLSLKPFNFRRDAALSGCLGFYVDVSLETNDSSSNLASNCLRVHTHWMEEQVDEIGSLPFVSVSFPGTHDAGSYKRADLVKTFLDYYFYSQEEDIFSQLMLGARFFDLRIGFTPDQGENPSDWFHIVHSYFITSNRVKTVFEDVRDFLKLYPNEIVLLDMHRFPVGNWDDETFTLFAELIETELGPWIIRVDPSVRSLEEVLATGRRVLITCNDDSFLSDLYFKGVVNVWANTDEVTQLHQYFEGNLPRHFRGNRLYSAMAELTPQGILPFIFDTYGGGLRGMADRHNFETMLWFRHDRDLRSNTTIIAMDFFASTDIVEISKRINLERAKAQLTGRARGAV
ncbi:uncharacterized protein LOC100900477 [Galendromus occidentalis]|uniref:Uncharacterized protein LOC100900477 n=1 Tax=Galendromus occidentalis TaxID=34638 RepID=A0AAJ6QPA0_9ACAR|nr:uncharacterized protein LOC100900477 [Galendromus occidentalis]